MIVKSPQRLLVSPSTIPSSPRRNTDQQAAHRWGSEGVAGQGTLRTIHHRPPLRHARAVVCSEPWGRPGVQSLVTANTPPTPPLNNATLQTIAGHQLAGFWYINQTPSDIIT
ncbi:hypothetical protein J6590_040116 [Homalodisca vitripennis]|nr:hypothetical protein J6590_040116 [Homalodisca vitripennis]